MAVTARLRGSGRRNARSAATMVESVTRDGFLLRQPSQAVRPGGLDAGLSA